MITVFPGTRALPMQPGSIETHSLSRIPGVRSFVLFFGLFPTPPLLEGRSGTAKITTEEGSLVFWGGLLADEKPLGWDMGGYQRKHG